ncbi:MAG: hypothetical protein EBS05_16290 [Proteobacteria bacterium]|nr:hypothetical protein [Pseudomonadota bacterium]
MSSLHTSSQRAAKAVWPDFNGAKVAFDRIVPGQTTIAELRELGFDPYQNANVRVLNYLDIQNRFLPTPSIRMEDLPAPVRQSLDAKEQSLAYELDLTVLNAQRYGNLVLDMLAFNRKTHETGWSFKALILLNHDKVLYKLWSGQPHLDRLEQKKQPLGPFQDLEGVARFSVLH